MSAKPEKDLKPILDRVATGDKEAFKLLFESRKDKVYSFALYVTHSETMAEEATQEVFIKVWTHRKELKSIRYFNSWVKTLVKNQCYSYLRHLAVERRYLKDMRIPQGDLPAEIEKEMQLREYRKLLEKAIAELPPRQKEVYLLSRREGKKQAQIADALGLSLHTVKNHSKAALHAVRTFLIAHKGELILLFMLYFFSKT